MINMIGIFCRDPREAMAKRALAEALANAPTVVSVRRSSRFVRERNRNAGYSGGAMTDEGGYEALMSDGSTQTSQMLPEAWAPFLEKSK